VDELSWVTRPEHERLFVPIGQGVMLTDEDDEPIVRVVIEAVVSDERGQGAWVTIEDAQVLDEEGGEQNGQLPGDGQELGGGGSA
jgi:hypothetical protein